MAPTIVTALAVNADNTTATITFSEAVFKSDRMTPLDYNDFGVATTGIAVLDTNNCSVATIDDITFTFTLAYSTVADAGDTLTLTGTVYDTSNGSLNLSNNNAATISLNDLTTPPPIIYPIITSDFSW